MVATPSKLLAAPALAVACVALLAGHAADATSILGNPVTILDPVVPMNNKHPAFGAPPRVVLATVIPDNTDEERAAGQEITNTTALEIATAQRKLEGAATDTQKLEAYFGKKLVTNYNTLMSKYASGSPTNIPWPAHYWPIYLDSINHRWKSPTEPSPAEKYATAFGKNVKQFMDTVSRTNGVDSYSQNKKCTTKNDCASDGSACAIREGAKSGYCIPTWYGICHAWAPASNWEPEPKCNVVKNGVTFTPYDLKGLVTAVYDGAEVETVFTGSRFYGPDSPAPKDKYGRFQDATRRDLGAGFFHLAISNIMGVNKHSFVVDVTAASEVWNQPVRSYEVVESKILKPAAAGKEYFGTNKYPFNDAAVNVAYTKTRFSYIIEAYEDGPLVPNKLAPYTTTVEYEYFVELDASNNIIGGEWLGDSRYEHPDFLWFATGAPKLNTVTSIGLSYKEVRALIDQSVACKDQTTPAPTTAKPTETPAPTTTKPAVTTPAPTTAEPTKTPATTSPTGTKTPETTAPSETPAPGKPTTAPVTPAPGTTTQSPPSGSPVDTPAPGKPTTAPVTPAPGKPTTAPSETPAPGKPTTAPVTPAPGKPTTAPSETPAPGKPTTAPVTPTPGTTTQSPPSGSPVDTPAPGKPTTAPVTPAPGKPTTAPSETPAPGKPTTAPVTPAPGTTTQSPPSGSPVDTPAPGKPTTAPVTPAPGKPTGPGQVSPPGGDDDDDVTTAPTSGAGKPTPVTPATTPASTTASPTDGKATVSPPGGDDDDDDEIPTPAQTTAAPAGGKGTLAPPSDDDSEEDDDDVPPSAVTTPSVAPVAGQTTPSPASGAGKPTPAPSVPASGDSASTPEPTKKKKKSKECHA